MPGLLRRRPGFAVRLALLAVVAQALIPVVHHIYHGYPIIAAAAVSDQAADPAPAGHHGHEPAKKNAPPPAPDNRTPVCPVCQSAQQLAAALPPPGAQVFVPPRLDGEMLPAPDAAATASPTWSPAQPRAPPPLIA